VGRAAAAGRQNNFGATCYLSSALQLLLRFQPFTDELQGLHDRFPSDELFTILLDISERIANETPIAVPTIRRLIDFFSIDRLVQCDICEFMTRLLNRILEPTHYDKAIAKLFYFHFRANGDPANTLFCHISTTASTSIAAHYAAHRPRFRDLPSLLLFQIERAVIDGRDSHSVKDKAEFIADDQLDIDGEVYFLYAVVEHIGERTTSGHYVVYVRDAKGWLYCNDDSVTASSLRDVQTTSREPRSPVTVCAYVRDLSAIRLCPREALPHSADRVVLRMFDAQQMAVLHEFAFSPQSKDEALGTIDDVVHTWETNVRARLRVSYRVGNHGLRSYFPDGFDVTRDVVECWVERASMRIFQPPKVMPISVVYEILGVPRFRAQMAFHGGQTVDDLIDHGKRLITTLARDHPLRFFIRNARSPCWIQIIKRQSETILFELEALQFTMCVLIVFDDPPGRPPGNRRGPEGGRPLREFLGQVGNPRPVPQHSR
jgi:hypothetical protein